MPEGAADNAFDRLLSDRGLDSLRAAAVDTLQVNLGRLCNQACRHCHVDAGPHRTARGDNMTRETAEQVAAVIRGGGIQTLDLTGGAPELNPSFRSLVETARAVGVHVMDRCNLSVLFEPGQEDLAEFLAAHRVEVVASLPYYRAERTDRQRGTGVFDRSIAGLQRLNALGYGTGGGLELNLVYNPVGAYLPGDQAGLESDYRHELRQRHGVRFDHLFCLTNMPIARFADWLQRSGNLEHYMATLVQAFNPAAVDGVMCRSLVSVAPDGTLHDCDFNQMLGMPVDAAAPQQLADFDADRLGRRRVVTGSHCLGCTAGAGSSCGGTLVR